MTTTANDASTSMSRIRDRFESMACLNASLEESTASYSYKAQSTSCLNEITKLPPSTTGRGVKPTPPKTKPKPSLGYTKLNGDSSLSARSNLSAPRATDTTPRSSTLSEGQNFIVESHLSGSSVRQSSKDLEDDVFGQEIRCGETDTSSQTAGVLLVDNNTENESNIRKAAIKIPPPPAARHRKQNAEPSSEPSVVMAGQSGPSISDIRRLSQSENTGLESVVLLPIAVQQVPSLHLSSPGGTQVSTQVSHVSSKVNEDVGHQLTSFTTRNSLDEDCSELNGKSPLAVDAVDHQHTASCVVDVRGGMTSLSPHGVKASRGPPPPPPVRNISLNQSTSNLPLLAGRNKQEATYSSSISSPEVEKTESVDHTNETFREDDVIVKQVNDTDDQEQSLKYRKDKKIANVRQLRSGKGSPQATPSQPLLPPLLPPTPPPPPLATTPTTPSTEIGQLNSNPFPFQVHSESCFSNTISSKESFVSNVKSRNLISSNGRRPTSLYPPGVQDRDQVRIDKKYSSELCLASILPTATPTSSLPSADDSFASPSSPGTKRLACVTSLECSREVEGSHSNIVDSEHHHHVDNVKKNDVIGTTDEQRETTRQGSDQIHDVINETNVKVKQNGDRSLVNQSAGNRKSYIIYAEQIGKSFTFLDEFDDAIDEHNDDDLPPPPASVFQTSTDACLSSCVSATGDHHSNEVNDSISGPSSSSLQPAVNINSEAVRPRDIRRPNVADIEDYKRMSAGRVDAIMTVNDAFSFLELGENV